MRLRTFLTFTSIFLLFSSEIFAESEDVEIFEMSHSREWQVALQYWKNIIGQTVSRIDEPKFFYSPEGRVDPESEMKAYLKVLIKGENLEEDVCMHPARYRTLNALFRLEEKKLVNPPECTRLKTWKSGVGGRSISLIFPSAYLNNPASMYGHTFLRFNSKDGSEDALLAYGASFGATTGTDGGFVFAFKGLLGGYRATYSLEPYYDLTKKYGDIEHRDIWEYELNLTSDEIDRALDFIWEVGNSYTDYYFFDENCSLYVLAALEFARPSLHLIDKFGLYVIPSDSLRLLKSIDGLVGNIKFRPSLTSRLEDQAKELSSTELSVAKKIAHSEIDIPEGDVRSLLIEFSFDYLEYLNNQEEIKEEEARRLSIEILKKRSELKNSGTSPVADNQEINMNRPDFAHPSGRLIMGMGSRGDKFFSGYHLHPAYHDALDPGTGLVRGQAIQFFDLKLRHYENDNLELFSFYPVSIESYAPVGKVFSPISWEVKVGADRQMIPKNDFKNEEGSLIGVLQGGAGKTLGGEDFLLSALIDIRASASPAYASEKLSLGAGPVIKFSYSLSQDLRVLMSGSLVRMGVGEEHWLRDINFGAQYDLSDDFAIRGNFLNQESFDREFSEAMLGGVWYF